MTQQGVPIPIALCTHVVQGAIVGIQTHVNAQSNVSPIVHIIFSKLGTIKLILRILLLLFNVVHCV